MGFIGKGSSMQVAHFIHKRLAKFSDFIGEPRLSELRATRLYSERGAHFDHDLDLLSFGALREGKNKLANMFKAFSANRPNIRLFSRPSRLLMSFIINQSTERFLKPINKIGVSIRNLYIGLIIRKLCNRITAKVSDIYTALSIYYARKIRNIRILIFNTRVVSPFLHRYPSIIECNTTLQINTWNAQPQRLTPLAHGDMGCYSLNCLETCRGRSEEVSPPSKIGHKSNRIIEINNSICQLQDPVLNETAKLLGISLRQTEDQITRDMLAATAAFINSTGGTNGDVPTQIAASDVDIVTQTLLTANAETIMDNIEGEDKFGTAPVRNAYFALCSTQLTSTLNSVGSFIQVNQYPAPMNALKTEWGAIGNLRFLISSIGSSTTGASALGNTVYNIFCVGMEAYACVEQDGYMAQFIYRPPIFDGPLALNASVGYKFAEVPRILNDLWLLNLRSTT